MTDTNAGRRPKRRPDRAARRRAPAWLFLAAFAAVVALAGIVYVGSRSGGTSATPVAWARFRTQDIHSLAVDPADSKHVFFGHHGGLLEARDGGVSWKPLPVRDDAMSMAAGSDGSMVIAGHEVFSASADGGTTWRPVITDLPGLDIHGFTRDPDDPTRMWASLATGGLWASSDAGSRWARVQQENIGFPVAVRGASGTRLVGVSASGLGESNDGGRTWTALETPPTYPMTSLTASPDGASVYAGSLSGLWKSTDAGRTWAQTTYRHSAMALATGDDGRTVVVVSKETESFRSSDGGLTWPGP